MKRNGFTLVELSIVLVILGLLVGGVLSGQSLIHAAELRSIAREHSQYVTAINAFRDKYSAIPGDMKNAVKFWGAADGGTADGVDTDCTSWSDAGTPATGTLTCNGDGDNVIGSGYDHEPYTAWQHLRNAGLIEGNYPGVKGDEGANQYQSKPGFNIPASKFPGAGWGFNARGYLSAPRNVPNSLCFGKPVDDGSCTGNAALTPGDAYNVDTKLDDGKPNAGAIHTVQEWNVPCSSSLQPDAEYAVNLESVECALLFLR